MMAMERGKGMGRERRWRRDGDKRRHCVSLSFLRLYVYHGVDLRRVGAVRNPCENIFLTVIFCMIAVFLLSKLLQKAVLFAVIT